MIRQIGLWLTTVATLAALDGAAGIETLILDEAIARADVIAVVHVERIRAEGQCKIAEAVIRRLVKGPPGQRHLRFLASSRSACDTSRADEGETCLVFLERWENRARTLSTEPGEPCNAPGAGMDTGPVFAILHHGRGRMPVLGDPDCAVARLWEPGICLPRGLETRPVAVDSLAPFYLREVRLNDLMSFVEDAVAAPSGEALAAGPSVPGTVPSAELRSTASERHSRQLRNRPSSAILRLATTD